MIGALRRGEARIDFTKLWSKSLVLSAAVVVVCIVSLVVRGLNLGIDFEGGTAWEVPAPGVSVADARSALTPVGEDRAKIQTLGSDTLRVQSDTDDPETIVAVREALADEAGVGPEEVGVTTVGPSWGDEITNKAQRALLAFFVVIALYISLRMQWKMAVGAMVAVLHDIVVTVGVYSIFQFEVTPATVIAFLTILGYSLYDTIVVFDKVRDNEVRVGAANRLTYTGMVSQSMNQVFMRSVNTTITSVIPVLSMLVVGSFILGAATLREFSVALLIGLLAGTYSSLFVAAPVTAWLKERDDENASVRHRISTRDGEDGPAAEPVLTTPAPTTPSATPDRPRTKGPTSTSKGQQKRGAKSAQHASGYSSSHPPRPRKKGKKR